MKKIIIVLNNMEVGGVQKSLYNLLWEIHDRYDVTLCLFQAKGPYLSQIPSDVKLITCSGAFSYLGLSQKECKGLHRLIRGMLVVISRAFGRSAAIGIMRHCEKRLPENYDCAIAFLHNGNVRHFYGGVQDYVLYRVKAKKKIAFLHCDYGKCGADAPANNRLISRFDRIAACSDGCRESFESVVREQASKCITVRNCHRKEEICSLANQDTVTYNDQFRNVVMVSRLSREKGIERAIQAVAHNIGHGIPTMLHIVGGGGMRPMLEAEAERCGIAQYVHFYGEQKNPYRYMKNADLFLMTSYHEAAPMVIEEAQCLCLPVLTVENTSSYEMVTTRGAGWVCDNSLEALTESLKEIVSNENLLREIRNHLQETPMNNESAIKQFVEMIEAHYDN